MNFPPSSLQTPKLDWRWPDNWQTAFKRRSKQANAQVEQPGGTNYRLPATIPNEIIAGILFYAIAAANQGWTK
jgi:hypothetical protein